MRDGEKEKGMMGGRDSKRRERSERGEMVGGIKGEGTARRNKKGGARNGWREIGELTWKGRRGEG